MNPYRLMAARYSIICGSTLLMHWRNTRLARSIWRHRLGSRCTSLPCMVLAKRLSRILTQSHIRSTRLEWSKMRKVSGWRSGRATRGTSRPMLMSRVSVIGWCWPKLALHLKTRRKFTKGKLDKIASELQSTRISVRAWRMRKASRQRQASQSAPKTRLFNNFSMRRQSLISDLNTWITG